MMKTMGRLAVVVVFVMGFSASVAGATDRASDETEIHKAVRAYVEAFNRGDAEAVADCWSEKGQWVSPSGNRIEGREAIRREMEAYFDEVRKPHIEVIDPKIRFLAPNVAVEEGHARVVRRGEEPSETSYLAIHVKHNGRWELESVRETTLPPPPSNTEQLEQLEWMVGTWVDQGENTRIETTFEWTKNRNFLTRSFKVVVEDEVVLSGTQVIGWDAARKQMRSWLFDSEGGFAEGIWRRDGNRWIVRNKQTSRDGRLASSINVLTRVDDDTMTWQSTDREIDGRLQPNLGPVTVRRQ